MSEHAAGAELLPGALARPGDRSRARSFRAAQVGSLQRPRREEGLCLLSGSWQCPPSGCERCFTALPRASSVQV